MRFRKNKYDYQSGDVIGNLVFLNREPHKINENGERVSRHQFAKFKCVCGKEFVLRIDIAKNQNQKSCGCLTSAIITAKQTVHGHTLNAKTLGASTEYKSWLAMWSRCRNPKQKNYSTYSKLGVCDEWKDFTIFLKDMGLKPTSKHTIDRINNELGYSKANCRWLTNREQQRNKLNTIYLEFEGVKKSLMEWSEIYNFNYKTIHHRIFNRDWDIGKAFKTPSRKYVKVKNI